MEQLEQIKSQLEQMNGMLQLLVSKEQERQHTIKRRKATAAVIVGGCLANNEAKTQ